MTYEYDLYHAACEADDAFERELRRVYGAGASDARYRQHHDDPAVVKARDAKIKADELWLAYQRRVTR